MLCMVMVFDASLPECNAWRMNPHLQDVIPWHREMGTVKMPPGKGGEAPDQGVVGMTRAFMEYTKHAIMMAARARTRMHSVP